MSAARVRLKRILCPTDFSGFSARALRHAAALSVRFDARLTVLHVVPFSAAHGANMPCFPTLPLVATPQLRRLANEQLWQFVEPVLGDRVHVTLELRDGEPWREIRRMADELAADLLVMGTHGRGGFERLLLGSVAEKLLHSVACPVLTVCHEEPRGGAAPGLPARILCATDLSELSTHTIAFALSLAAEHQSHVTLLHVLEGQPAGTADRQWAGQQLQRAVSDEARAWCEVEERVETGRAYARILELAKVERSDLIVIGSRGRGALGTAFFGSTSQHVVRAAACPVLTVGPPRNATSAVASWSMTSPFQPGRGLRTSSAMKPGRNATVQHRKL